MSKIIYYKQEFQCSTCEKIFKKYIWSNSTEAVLCSCDNLTPCDPFYREIGESAGYIDKTASGKHAKGRSPKEKNERRLKDFNKELAPYIPKWEKREILKKIKNK